MCFLSFKGDWRCDLKQSSMFHPSVLGVHHRVRYLKLNMSQYLYWLSVILRSAGCSEKYSLLLEVTSCQRLHTVGGFHLERQDVHSLEVPDSIWWMSLINSIYGKCWIAYTLRPPKAYLNIPKSPENSQMQFLRVKTTYFSTLNYSNTFKASNVRVSEPYILTLTKSTKLWEVKVGEF